MIFTDVLRIDGISHKWPLIARLSLSLLADTMPLHWSLILPECPGFPEVMAELFNPPAADVAAYLGVNVRTVQRWIRTGRAPRAAVLALHRISRPGLAQTHAELLRDLRSVDEWGLSVQREAAALRRELARVLAAADFGAANRPTMRAPELPAPPASFARRWV